MLVRRLAPLALILCLAPPAGAAPPRPDAGWQTRLGPALAQAEREGKLLLVDLYAEWCPWCERLDELVFTTSAFREAARDFVLVRVDTEDQGEGSRLAARLGIRSLPTLLILDHRQVQIGTVRGFHPVDIFLRRIEAELARYAALEESLAASSRSSDPPDPELIRGLARELHERGDGARAAGLYDRLLALGAGDEGALRYAKADALRRAGDLDGAAREAAAARRATRDSELAERLALLAAEIDRERGRCSEARATLEDFLARHPASPLVGEARETLRALDEPAFCG
jgi:thioredoxin-like negative regulator of GroEL